MNQNEKKEPLLSRSSFQEANKKAKEQATPRLSEKEKGRRLDRIYTWSIIGVSIAIVLVIVLAFFI